MLKKQAAIMGNLISKALGMHLPATKLQSGAMQLQFRVWWVLTIVKKMVDGRASDARFTRALMSAI